MREILFRGFYPVSNGKEKIFIDGKWINGRWVYGGIVKTHLPESDEYEYFVADESIDGRQYLVTPETVGEYTGLEDKNGKKIFEGDIIGHRSNYSGNDIVCKVKYDKYYGAFMCEFNNGQSSFLADLKNIEVIGNVHSNPELLEG